MLKLDLFRRHVTAVVEKLRRITYSFTLFIRRKLFLTKAKKKKTVFSIYYLYLFIFLRSFLGTALVVTFFLMVNTLPIAILNVCFVESTGKHTSSADYRTRPKR